MLKVFANSGGQIDYKAEELCAILNTFAGNTDYIIQGIENEMQVSYSATSLNITVKKGKAIIGGRPCGIFNSNEVVSVPASTSNLYLVFEIDLSKLVGQEASLKVLTQAQLIYENLNNNGVRRDFVLGKFNTNASGVTSYTDMRVIKSRAGGLEYTVVATL